MSTSGSGNGGGVSNTTASGSNTLATPTNDGAGQNEDQSGTQRRRTRNNNNNNSNTSNNSNRNTIQLTNPKSFQGAISDIGSILALRHEKLDHKKQFQVFMEKVGTYVLSNLKDGGDVSRHGCEQ